jgi:hypothetical protein
MPFMMWIVAADFVVMSFFDGTDYLQFCIGMLIEGFFIGGPYMIISAAIAADLVSLVGRLVMVFRLNESSLRKIKSRFQLSAV